MSYTIVGTIPFEDAEQLPRRTGSLSLVLATSNRLLQRGADEVWLRNDQTQQQVALQDDFTVAHLTHTSSQFATFDRRDDASQREQIRIAKLMGNLSRRPWSVTDELGDPVEV